MGKVESKLHNETLVLDQIAKNSLYTDMCGAKTIKYSGKIFKRFLNGTSCLEFGPAEGLMTEELSFLFENYTAVDGSTVFCEKLKEKLPNVEVVCSLFESFESEHVFDTVLLGHVLEHVDDPVSILKKIRSFMSKSSVIICAVPNAKSIHRQAAVRMGLISDEYQLSELDIRHGHRRVYDRDSLVSDFLSAGFRIDTIGGYWLKPLTNGQIEASWTEEMLDAFFELGESYSDIAAEIYIVAHLE